MSSLQTTLRQRLLSRLVAEPAGRAHILNQAAEAEDADEAHIFDLLLAQVDDEALRKMIERHRDDETRHAAMFRAALARNGVAPRPMPAELRLIDRIDRALGNQLDRAIVDARGVMQAYLLLQVIEERAVTQFEVMEPAFRAVDPETADVFAAIACDEARHLKYCHAISGRYAPSDAERLATLRRYRAIEARAFGGQTRANLRYVVTRGIVRVGPLERALWLGLAELGDRRDIGIPTRFAHNDEAARRARPVARAA